MKKPILKYLNLVQVKEKQINFISKEISFKRIEQNLANLIVQEKIKFLENKFQKQICLNLPFAFCQRKQHMVGLPYEKEFKKKNPDKARPIQMN